jgi:hypothetical protein
MQDRAKTSIPDLDFYIGSEASVKRANYAVDYPIRRGIVDNWDNMERYWQRCICTLLHYVLCCCCFCFRFDVLQRTITSVVISHCAVYVVQRHVTMPFRVARERVHKSHFIYHCAMQQLQINTCTPILRSTTCF